MQDADAGTAARLRFLDGVWRVQDEADVSGVSFSAPDVETGIDASATGQPLFLVSAPGLPRGAFLDTVERMAALVADTAGLPDEQVAALRQTDFRGVITDEMLVDAARRPEGFLREAAANLAGADGTDLSSATVLFVLSASLTPFVSGPAGQALEAVGDRGRQAWDQGSCPVCGSAAGMARMGEGTQQEGSRRVLWCALCHAEWPYERLRCARCGSRDQAALRYTFVDSDPVHRLHLCDTCHGYVKTTFEGELNRPLSMPVEDAVSTFLDAVAHENGYTASGDGGVGGTQ